MKTYTYRVICPEPHKNNPGSISVLRVVPEGTPRYILQLIHGISEHKGRYLPLMEYAAAHGVEVVAHDLPGHGMTAPAGQLGIMNNLGYDYATLRMGIDLVYASLASDDIREEEHGLTVAVHHPENPAFPDLPRFLLGHSMGSLAAGLYTARQPDTLAGLILVGLPFRHRSASLGVLGMNLLEGIFGEEAHPAWVNKLAFDAYNKQFHPEPQSDGQFMWLSCDIDNRYEFLADPLCHYDKAICTFTNLLRMVRDFYRSSFWDMSRPDLPMLLLSGEKDPVTGGDKQILIDRNYLNHIGFRDVSARMYKNLRHEILRDFGKETVFDDILRFCDDHLTQENTRLENIRKEYEPQFTKKA